jgi:hypothetical protein
MNRTASTSRNIFAVRSAMTCRSGKLAVMKSLAFAWDGFRVAQPIP